MLWERDMSGVYRQFSGANALEGLVRCADAGAAAVELDFSFTADGALVCLHHWSEMYIPGAGYGVPMSLAEFRASRIYGCFTPLTLADAAAFFREHPDMTLVTDIKERFDEAAEVIAEACADFSDRVVVQIYEESQYGIARTLGFERIAYTLYALPWEEKLDTAAHTAFAQTHDLEWIAFDVSLCDHAVFLEEMLRIGVPLYVHTVNEKETTEFLLDIGIAGVYTDTIIRNP